MTIPIRRQGPNEIPYAYIDELRDERDALRKTNAELLEALMAMLDAHKFDTVHLDQPDLIEANRKARVAIDNALREG